MLAQALVRRRWRPQRAYGWGDLRSHLFPSRDELDRRKRRELPYLGIGTLMLDEARDLREWIEFHRLQGVERFFIYDNGSADEPLNVLQPYIDQGLVEFTPWASAGDQHGAIQDCFARHRDHVRWLVFMDVDEFLFCPTGERIADVLPEFERYPAVAVHWHLFGTSDVADLASGAEILPTFKRRLDDFGPQSINMHIKSIVDPWSVIEGPPPSTHHRHYRVGLAVNEIGRPVHGPTPWPIHCDRLRINHYWTKSLADVQRKLDRSPTRIGDYPARRLEEFTDPRYNAVEERAILHVRERLVRGEPARAQSSFRPLLATWDVGLSLMVFAWWMARFALPHILSNRIGRVRNRLRIRRDR